MGLGILSGRVGSLLGLALITAGSAVTIGSAAAGAQRAASATTAISLPGTRVMGIALNADTGIAYVSGMRSSAFGTVSVVNLAADAVTATIAVGDMPEAVAVNPVTGTVYVANEADGTISVIDGASNTLTDTIQLPGPEYPRALTVDTETNTVYVALTGTSPAVAVISGSSNSVVTTIASQAVGNAAAIAYDPASGAVYDVFEDAPCCSGALVIDAASNSLTKTIALSGYPQAMVVDPTASAFYVSGSNTVTAYSTATDAAIGVVAAFFGSTLAVDPDTHTVFVDSAGDQATAPAYATAPGFTSVIEIPGPGLIALDPATETLVDATVQQNTNSTISLIPLQAPRITSSASTKFTDGTPGDFGFSATGIPSPRITEKGKLPAGLWLNSEGMLVGTPNPGTGGIYPVTIGAANGVAPTASQRFSLIVDQAPAITSANHATFTYGKHASFTVRTAAFPVSSVTEHGTLPPGLRFSQGKNGTATISGSPGKSARGKTYAIALTARNGVGAAAIQRFTLRVD